jgi:hypothetical protein
VLDATGEEVGGQDAGVMHERVRLVDRRGRTRSHAGSHSRREALDELRGLAQDSGELLRNRRVLSALGVILDRHEPTIARPLPHDGEIVTAGQFALTSGRVLG